MLLLLFIFNTFVAVCFSSLFIFRCCLFLQQSLDNFDAKIEIVETRVLDKSRSVKNFVESSRNQKLISKSRVEIKSWTRVLTRRSVYQCFCCKFITISTCINSFNKIIKLSYAYKIQKQWYDRASDKVFKFKNFYFHWRYIKFTEQEQNIEVFKTLLIIDRYIAQDILRVQESIIIKIKNRLQDLLN